MAGIVLVGIWVVVFEFFGTTVCFVAVILFVLERPPWFFISGVTYSKDDDFDGCTDDVISSYNNDSSPSVVADACDNVDPGTDFDGENGDDVNTKVLRKVDTDINVENRSFTAESCKDTDLDKVNDASGLGSGDMDDTGSDVSLDTVNDVNANADDFVDSDSSNDIDKNAADDGPSDTFTGCGDGTVRKSDSDTDKGVNDTDIDADGSNDDIVVVVDDANDAEADIDTSDLDAGTVIEEDVAENNSRGDPDTNDDAIGTKIDDTEMEGIIDVNSNDVIDNEDFDFDLINEEDGDTGSNTDCSSEVDDVEETASDGVTGTDVDTSLDFCCDTGDEKYIVIETKGAVNLDANIVIELDVVGDSTDNFGAAIDVDFDSDTDRDSGCESEKEVRLAGFVTDDETVRNVGDRDTDNECETDIDVVFDNDIEGTACFETDADSDKGLVCNTDDRVAETDVGCDIDNNPELVRDSRTDSDTNVDFSTNSKEKIVCVDFGSVTDTADGAALDADCDNDASDGVVGDTDNEATADTDDISGTETDELGENDADRLSGKGVFGILMYAVGDTVADCVTGTATDGDNETDADGAGDNDCEANRVVSFPSDRDTDGTSDVDAGTVIDEDVAENNSRGDPDTNSDVIGTKIDDTEMKGVIDVNSNDAIDDGALYFDAINDEDGDTGSNTDCSTELDNVG